MKKYNAEQARKDVNLHHERDVEDELISIINKIEWASFNCGEDHIEVKHIFPENMEELIRRGFKIEYKWQGYKISW